VTDRRYTDFLALGNEGGLPYSKGLLARALIATGLSNVRAYELALRVEEDLAARGEQTLDLERLEVLAQVHLGESAGIEAVRRLRRYRDLQHLDLPIVLLIGGGTGTGKSRIATEVAYRLGITRVTSTDFIRQTMRAFFSEEFMPSIHHSSFEAGNAIPASGDTGDPVLAGFLDQTRNVLVGVRAVVERTLHEGWSMVLEGVHLVPGLVPVAEGVLAVQCVLAVEEEDIHAGNFWVRDTGTEGLRPVQRYLDALDDIRYIQRYIVERAEHADVPVIENSSIEQTIAAVMELVLSSAERLEGVGSGSGR
jgi:2-phosphoglycerate kinase